MQKRQLILLVAALAALIYAAVDLTQVKAEAPRQTAQVRQQAQQMVADLAGGLAKNNLSSVEAYTLSHAGRGWNNGIFTQVAQNTAEQAADLLNMGPQYVYQGYIAMGRVRMAVIDDQEYRTGEELKDGRFEVKSISPTRVVLTSLAGGGETSLALAEPARKRKPEAPAPATASAPLFPDAQTAGDQR